LHAALRGLQASGAYLVSDPGKDALSTLGGSLDGLSRGSAGQPSSAGAAALLGGRAQPVPARRGVRPWLLRGLGAVRGALDGRARLPPEPRLRIGHAPGPSLPRHARRGGHRRACRTEDPLEGGLSPGRDLVPRTDAAIRRRAWLRAGGIPAQRGRSLPRWARTGARLRGRGAALA